MRVAIGRASSAVAMLLVAATALAQFGHPLKGTWSGDWGTTKENRTRVLLEFQWDGKMLAGTINPGPKAVTMKKVDLAPETWQVHIEADGKDAAGAAVRYVIDGKLENIGAYARVFSGTWTEGSKKGDFRVVRN